MKAPPSKGPTTLAMPHTAPMIPVNAGLFGRGTDLAMIMSAPEKIPAPPIPAIARPIIRATELGLAPQIAEPISKINTAPTKVHFTGSKVYNLPKKSWKLQVVRRKALPYHPMSSTLLNSEVMVGIAVAMIVWSCL